MSLFEAIVGTTDDVLGSATGASVTPQRAMRVLAFFACVRILSNTIASLELDVYEKANGAKNPLDDPRADLLRDAPNSEMTPFTYWLYVMSSLCVWGNAYVYVELDGSGEPVALWPLATSSVTQIRIPHPETKKEVPAIVVDVKLDQKMVLLPGEYMHYAGVGLATTHGLAPYLLGRQALGIAMSAEDYAGRTFMNSSRPAGVITMDRKLDDEAFNTLTQRWKAGHEGLRNSHKVGFLPPGMNYVPIVYNADSEQHIAAREFEVTEMARLFGVPLHYLGMAGAQAYASVESQSIDFINYTLLPYLQLIQQVTKMVLFSQPKDKTRGVFLQHNTDPLLRADSVSRARVQNAQVSQGVKCVNDVRRDEGLPPVPGGDVFFKPVNTAPIDEKGMFIEPPPKPLAGMESSPLDDDPTAPNNPDPLTDDAVDDSGSFIQKGGRSIHPAILPD